jgi:hypothetical protein
VRHVSHYAGNGAAKEPEPSIRGNCAPQDLVVRDGSTGVDLANPFYPLNGLFRKSGCEAGDTAADRRELRLRESKPVARGRPIRGDTCALLHDEGEAALYGRRTLFRESSAP